MIDPAFSAALSRRRFVQAAAQGAAGAALTPLPWLAAGNAAKAAEADPFVRKSQTLPTPKVVLPTDALPAPSGRPKRIAALTTAYFRYSHADDIITKFIEGYSIVGRTHVPHCKVVSLYIEQFPPTDIGRGMAARYKIPLFDKPAAALTLGGDDLAVDGVLLIGEHGDYPYNEKGQHLYPRRRLFEEITKVFRQSGRSVPVFNDKHLSYSWADAEWMHQQSRELDFPLMAGSSVPVTWRRPPLAFLPGVPLESALVAGTGSIESYGFHCLELLQTFAEKRHNGETGVEAVQLLEGEQAYDAARRDRWPMQLLSTAIGTTPLAAQRPFDSERLRKSTWFRINYRDGFQAAVCLAGGIVDYCFAGSVRGRKEPVATCPYLPKPQRDHFSFLCNHIESMFLTLKPSYPVERTLLVTGILDALHDSRAAGGKRIDTPHLRNFKYTPAKELLTEPSSP